MYKADNFIVVMALTVLVKKISKILIQISFENLTTLPKGVE